MKPHKYRDLSPEQQEELFSNYLISHWSFSGTSSFARNQKAFEMQYLYRYPSKNTNNTVAGQAYHKALALYWERFKKKEECSVIEMEQVAFDHIDNKDANLWKISTTAPSVELCQTAAKKTSTGLINNFFAYIQVYLSDIKEIVAVELEIKCFIAINGVDIPLPIHCYIDLVYISNDDKRVILDHKSKRTFSKKEEIAFTGARQGISYVIAYEAQYGERIDEVRYIENKYSQNKDKSPQLRPFPIKMDDDTRRIYEAILYEPVKKMLEAVSDPNFVYLINDNDSFTDIAELYEFWATTMIAEIDDFNIPDDKKEMMGERLRKIRNAKLAAASPTTIKNFKTFTREFIPYDLSKSNMNNSEKIEHVLTSFGIPCKVEHKFEGFSSASYLLEMGAGVKLASVATHKLDLANALDVSSIRVQKDLFVYNGKSYLTVESSIKRTRDLYFDDADPVHMLIPIGVDNFGETIHWNLENHSTPHMLVGGATGSGKTVFLRSTIAYALLSGVKEVVIFDSKNDFKMFSSTPGLQIFSDIDNIELQMMMLVEEMEKRVQGGSSHMTLVVFDEFADAVANSRKGNDLKNFKMETIGEYKDGRPKTKRVCTSTDRSLEENLKMLLQKGRSSEFRIISSTQRASVKVITGDAKVNMPVQVCFRVPKEIDSMVVIGEGGAEALNGRGDGLIKSPEYLNTRRFQAFYKE